MVVRIGKFIIVVRFRGCKQTSDESKPTNNDGLLISDMMESV